MIQLPRGNPVKEKLNPARLNMPDVLSKLQSGKFSGYLRFDSPGGTGIFVCEKGRLISALFEAQNGRLTGHEAISRTFEESLSGKAALNIYRLSAELAVSVYALLQGEVLHSRQELKLIDIKSLLAALREQSLTGCLRIYTDDRVALIFYRDGRPLGFFHDGSVGIETTADTSMSVARLPGAKVDVLATQNSDQTILTDLMESVDLASMWEKHKSAILARRRTQEQEALRALALQEKQCREQIREIFCQTAKKHVGKLGVSLAGKEFDLTVEPDRPLSEDSLSGFYEAMVCKAKLLAGPSTIQAMIAEMKEGAGAVLCEN